MDPISILEQWVSPITEPLREFRAQIESLANIHYRSANTFQNLINDLTNPGAADSFKGKGADAASSLAETYTSGEMKIASNVTAAAPLAMAIVASTDAVAEIGGAVTEAASEVTDSEPLNEIVEVVDVTTIAQGGADVPEDIVAGGVTLARGISLLTIFLQFVTTLFFIWRSWDGSLYTAAHQAYPPLPGDPSKTVINPQNLSPLE
jgi:hypothetical protein